MSKESAKVREIADKFLGSCGNNRVDSGVAGCSPRECILFNPQPQDGDSDDQTPFRLAVSSN